ncbi:Putative syntaxin-131 [Coccomyxa sp. Obi]|nr:Putative syntaxin-131 [Coccomyxa sp. Obi]
MNDLLGSVKGFDAPRRPSQTGGPPDIEAGPEPAPPPTEQDKLMTQFFDEVSAIKGLLGGIRDKQRKLQEAHERTKTVTRTGEMKEIRERMQDDIEEVNKAARTVKLRIERLDKANEQSLSRKGCGVGSSSERTRTAITAALKKKLKDIMGEFGVLRQKLQQEYREVVERRTYTVTGQKASPEEIDRLIETGESETIFAKAILEQGRGHVLDTLAEIEERGEAVRELEKSLLDLHQIFLDMAVLVEAQGEMLDNIEAQVGKARNHVQQGVTQLVEAKKLQKKTRKLMCCALVTVLLIIIAIVLAVVRPWTLINKNNTNAG